MSDAQDPRGKLAARIAGVFLNPTKTLPLVSQEGRFWAPLILVSFFLVVLRLQMLPLIFEQYDAVEFKEWYIDARHVDPDGATRDIEIIKQWTPFLTVIEAPLMVVIGVAFVAFLVRLLGILKYKMLIPFRTVFNLVSWVTLVSIVPIILTIFLKLIDLNFDLPTNLGVLFSADFVGGYFHRLLLSFDLFLIWQIWLLSIGIASLFQLHIQKALSAIGTIFVFFAIVNALFGGTQ